MIRILVLLLAALPGMAYAAPETMDKVVARAVRKNYGALHSCYRRALAEDRHKGGTVFVQVTLGAGDSVVAAKVARDELKHAGAVGCLLTWVRGWSLHGAAAAGAGPTSEVIIPLTFRPLPGQYLVRGSDVTPVGDQKVRAKTLLSKKNAGAVKASLVLVTVKGEMALPARAGVEQALYVLSGRGELKAAGSSRPYKLRPGTAVWIPAQARAHLSGALEMLQVFTPPGLEQVYGEKLWKGGVKPFKPVVVKAPTARGLKLRRGKLRVKPLLHRRRLGHQRLYLGLLEAAAGQRMEAHVHKGEAELVYILSGKATITFQGVSAPVRQGQALYLPARARHSMHVQQTLKVVQVYAPAGPEQRFFKATRGGAKTKRKR